MNIKGQIKQLGLTLPRAPSPVGNYHPYLLSGNVLYISGQLPLADKHLVYQGKLGKNLTTTQGKEAAKLCALNILSQIEEALKSSPKEQKLKGIIKLEAYINTSEAFSEHAQVLDGASELLFALFGQQSAHVRTVAGCSSLPLGAAVEIAAIAELK